MTPASLVAGQIAALDRSLAQADKLLERCGQQQLTSDLLDRVRGLFRNRLLPLRSQCATLLQTTQTGNAAAIDLARLEHLQAECSDLIRECLAFLEGAYTRAAGIDGDSCKFADAMLLSLSKENNLGWSRFTLVGPAEFFSTSSGIVRLRFTDTGIWNLPVAVHEFGHFVSTIDAFREPFKASAAAAGSKDPKYKSHLGELFADLFATYVLGPAYLLNCALLRFPLSNASLESSTHPSANQRVWWMLETLTKMDDPGWPLYSNLVNQVRALWSAGVASANQPALSDAEISRLRPWFFDLYDLINSGVPNAKYAKWLRAQGLSQAFRQNQDPGLLPDDTIPEVLNALWLYRAQTAAFNAFEMEQVERQALQLCAAIVDRKP
jgi:hypothetical protein